MIALSAVAGTVAGQVVVLPNGYYLQPDQDGQTKLVKRNGNRAGSGHHCGLRRLRQYVAGALGKMPGTGFQFANDLEFTGTADTRYFILDTSSGKLEVEPRGACVAQSAQGSGAASRPEYLPAVALAD